MEPLPTPTTELPSLPPRAPGTHKGHVGRVLLVAGSRGMSGAAVLSGLGALRTGAGLVRVASPLSVQPLIAGSEVSLMTAGLAEDADGRLTLDGAAALDFDWPTVVAMGPGLGQTRSMPDVVAHVLRNFAGPVVLDADALNAGAQLGPAFWQTRAGGPMVVMPHPGEMARLRRGAGLADVSGDDDATRLGSAHEYAEKTGFTVVLKGYRTVVATSSAAYINTTGNPGMATGGMGDVLTGVVAALLAQNLMAFDAARLGVYVHGLAADHCARRIAPIGYLAREVADTVPMALAEATRPHIGFH